MILSIEHLGVTVVTGFGVKIDTQSQCFCVNSNGIVDLSLHLPGLLVNPDSPVSVTWWLCTI